jgi:CspA family cold shock protein
VFKLNTGNVRWFNESKGYGFIESQGKDYFVHFKSIQSEGFKTLKEGQKVSFVAADSPKGKTATAVRIED